MRLAGAVTLTLLLAVGAMAQSESDLAQMLNKALAEVEASRAALLAKDNVMALQRKLIDQQKAVIDAQDAENDAKQKVIDVLTALKCNETQFRPLGFTIYRSKRCY